MNTEEYDGTSWTATGNDLNAAARMVYQVVEHKLQLAAFGGIMFI